MKIAFVNPVAVRLAEPEGRVRAKRGRGGTPEGAKPLAQPPLGGVPEGRAGVYYSEGWPFLLPATSGPWTTLLTVVNLRQMAS